MRRIGFEGKLYWGVAGTTAATELKIAKDVSYKFEPTLADVSDRDSIIDYMKTAGVKFTLEFDCNNDDSNAFIAALRVAAASGACIAFKTKDKATGWGCDGDFTVSDDESQSLRDAQKIKVSCSPNNDIRGITWA